MSVHVRGHFRSTPSGGVTWVNSHRRGAPRARSLSTGAKATSKTRSRVRALPAAPPKSASSLPSSAPTSTSADVKYDAWAQARPRKASGLSASPQATLEPVDLFGAREDVLPPLSPVMYASAARVHPGPHVHGEVGGVQRENVQLRQSLLEASAQITQLRSDLMRAQRSCAELGQAVQGKQGYTSSVERNNAMLVAQLERLEAARKHEVSWLKAQLMHEQRSVRAAIDRGVHLSYEGDTLRKRAQEQARAAEAQRVELEQQLLLAMQRVRKLELDVEKKTDELQAAELELGTLTAAIENDAASDVEQRQALLHKAALKAAQQRLRDAREEQNNLSDRLSKYKHLLDNSRKELAQAKIQLAAETQARTSSEERCSMLQAELYRRDKLLDEAHATITALTDDPTSDPNATEDDATKQQPPVDYTDSPASLSSASDVADMLHRTHTRRWTLSLLILLLACATMTYLSH